LFEPVQQESFAQRSDLVKTCISRRDCEFTTQKLRNRP